MSSKQQPTRAVPNNRLIRLGDLEFDLVTRQEVWAKAPKDLVDDPDLNDPAAPDVSTLPISAIEEHPVSERLPGKPVVNLPSRGQPAPGASQEPSSSEGRLETDTGTGPLPILPVLRWEPHKAITDAKDMQYYVDIMRSIKRHLIAESETDIQETEEAYKGALLGVEQVVPVDHRRRQVFVAVLRHSIGNFPKLCNPTIAAGNAASKRLAGVIKHQASDRFGPDYRIHVSDINSAISDFCKIAYPYPQTGEANKTTRFKFVCFNNFAFHLASQKLLTSLDLPQRAIDAMMGKGELSNLPAYNHESVFVVSRWLTTPLGDRLLGEKGSETRAQLPEIYTAFVEYQAKYISLVEHDNREEFRLHKIAVKAAQAKLERLEPRLKAVEAETKRFEDVLEFALGQVQKGNNGPGNIWKQIADKCEIAGKAPENERPRLLADLVRITEDCKPLVPKEIMWNN
ncbi:hypothetical protein SLS62_004489 [Diatrype stigma]|uniref:Uncharacterized protein n=1 Tax=Diatrype stigma TaxID=117547 RepID=A0AAN9UUE6_9PEZI